MKKETLKKACDSLRGVNSKLTTQLHEVTRKLTDVNEKYLELEAQCETIGGYDPKALETEVNLKRNTVKSLEKNLKILCQNPFFAGSENKISLTQQLRENEKEVIELKAKLQA